MEFDKIQLKLIKKYKINLYTINLLLKNEIGIVSFPGSFNNCEIKMKLLKEIFDVMIPKHLYNNDYDFPLNIPLETFGYQFKHIDNKRIYYYEGTICKREKEVNIHDYFIKEMTLKEYNKLSILDFKKIHHENKQYNKLIPPEKRIKTEKTHTNPPNIQTLTIYKEGFSIIYT